MRAEEAPRARPPSVGARRPERGDAARTLALQDAPGTPGAVSGSGRRERWAPEGEQLAARVVELPVLDQWLEDLCRASRRLQRLHGSSPGHRSAQSPLKSKDCQIVSAIKRSEEVGASSRLCTPRSRYLAIRGSQPFRCPGSLGICCGQNDIASPRVSQHSPACPGLSSLALLSRLPPLRLHFHYA